MAKKLGVKKPPTQIAGISGFEAFEAGPNNEQELVDWRKLVNLPPFEMFVFEYSGQQPGSQASTWVSSRRALIGDSVFYEQYESWHKHKGLWPSETPMGNLTNRS